MDEQKPPSYHSLMQRLPAGPPLYNPPKLGPKDARLGADIAAASLHPTLEAAVSKSCVVITKVMKSN